MNTTYERDRSLAPPQKPEKDIVIVEDDHSVGSMLMELVKQETPYQSAHVSTGRQALSLIPQLSPRLLLLDYRLPDMTGLEVYSRLHSYQEQAPFSAILMSAQFPACLLDTPGLIYMQKPFELDLLLQAIDRLIEPGSASE